MASRPFAVPIPASKDVSLDRVIMTAALVFAVLSILVTWRTLAAADASSALPGLEAPRHAELKHLAQR